MTHVNNSGTRAPALKREPSPWVPGVQQPSWMQTLLKPYACMCAHVSTCTYKTNLMLVQRTNNQKEKKPQNFAAEKVGG